MRATILSALAICLVTSTAVAQDERSNRLKADQERFESSADWLYNDLERGFAESMRTGKPLLVVLRCVPCEACRVFDEQVARDNPRIRELLDQFVCVRVIKTNGLDLTLFQSDFDQSFAVFMLNADRTIYGRYGSRPESEKQETEMSLDGFAETLQAALDLHQEYPDNRAALAGKTPEKPEFATPEGFPALARYGEFANVKALKGENCIHCHMVREAERTLYRERKESIPEHVLFTWPSPRPLGFTLDPATASTVNDVVSKSPAALSGMKTGDRIRSVNGQAVISLADVKWALDSTGDASEAAVVVERDGNQRELRLELPHGWRTKTDISSRASTWDLRRMATGGLVLETLGAEGRRERKLADDAMALRIKYVGQYNEHAAGKHAGFREGDVIVAYDGQSNLMRETDLIAHGVTHHQRGESVPVTVLREGKRLDLRLPIQ